MKPIAVYIDWPVHSFSLSSSHRPARYIMETVDLVIVGAEGVAESGGIINKVPSVMLFGER